jgi:hypothetical protein
MYKSVRDDTNLNRFERELGASLIEFEHGLDLGAPGRWDSPTAGLYRVRHEGAELHIEILSQSVRRIAALTIPLLKVAYSFRSGSKQQRQTLLTRLDQAMQRGGG